MKFWNKRIKDEKVIAKALNEDVEKVKALKEGKLEIKGETLERTLKAIENEKINKAIKKAEIWKWFLETDFREKRKEFGYKTQREVAKIIGCDVSTICRLETNKEDFKQVSPRLIQVYEFYTNDFNKKTDVVPEAKNQPKVDAVKKYNTDKLRVKVTKENRHIWKWYKSTNIKQLRKDLGYKTGKEVADLIGVSQSCYSDLELKNFKAITRTMINAYNFYVCGEKEFSQDNTDAIYEWYKSIDDMKQYRRDFGYSLNKFMSELNLSYDQVRDFENKQYKSATKVVIRAYNFYHNEKNRLPKIDINNQNNFAKKEETKVADAVEETNQIEVSKEMYERKIKHLIDVINNQNDTIERYEKIIDKLVKM